AGPPPPQRRNAGARGQGAGTPERQRTHRLHAPPLRRHAGRGDRQDPRHSGECRQTHHLPRGEETARGSRAAREVQPMPHLNEEQLVAHYYRDADATAHLAECAECHAQFETLRRVLALVDEMPIPERDEHYGEQVWNRLRWRLDRRKGRTWLSALAAAAVLVLAFFLGRSVPRDA